MLRNRIVFGAHTANMAENGLPTERHVAYYAERAIGGAGMIVVEPMPVHPATVLTRGNFRPSDDAVIPHFAKVARAIKDNGAVAIQQLYHVGAHGDSDNSFHPHWSPSGLPSYHDSDGSRAMSEDQIWETIDGFVEAARRCKEAGFDGVEVWAAYHGMVDQFWTPWSNRRDDRWGGSLENRMRFLLETVDRVRSALPKTVLIVRLSCTEYVSDGYTEAEIIEHCRTLLARFKCPKAIIFAEIPKTSTGKIQKFRLREMAREG